MSDKILHTLKVLANYPLEEFGLTKRPDAQQLTGANDWRLTVGDVKIARQALEEVTTTNLPTLRERVRNAGFVAQLSAPEALNAAIRQTLTKLGLNPQHDMRSAILQALILLENLQE